MTEHQLDPDVAEWLIQVRPGDVAVSVAQARIQSREANLVALAKLDPKLTPASEIDASIDTPHGPMPIRVLRPETSGPKPTVVYFHGGGWVVGDLDSHLGHARRICVQADAVVVSVQYRLAPEHRFPAAFDDAVLATQWVAERLAEFGGSQALVVAGDSVGGQLAASVAVARRDAGQPLAAQLLLYPVTDVAGRYADPEVNAHYMSRGTSHQRFGLTLDGMTAFAHHYVSAEDSADWRVSPIRALDLSGVAPAVIHTSTLDVLRTEGNFYADRLREAGVPVIAREFPSLNHSYFGLGGISAVADAAAAQAAEDLRDLLQRDAG
ncbi:MAG TPA: alpha/beta hydrolase [Jatrophihabitans sp.]|nr:alpha/beta hydrolase [Jatrophihabitans sp.]